jgi:transposase-like protein
MPMRKSHFTEEQIAYALRQAETGTAATEVCRAMGVSEQTYYRWKKQYGGRAYKRFDGLNCSRRRIASSSSWWRT